jgi:putative phosphoesterase
MVGEKAFMRIAFISDIHGSFTALEAVVADIKQQGVDQIICLGDAVSLGPQPIEVLNTLRELNSVNLKGNHDAAILDPSQYNFYQITEHLLPDLHWGRERLSKEDFEFIDAFQDIYSLKFPNGVEVLAFHGSPISKTDLIQSSTEVSVLDSYFVGQTANVFIGGHSHIQMQRRYGDKLIINSGSIGNAFKFAYSPGNPPSLLPWAEYAILEQTGNLLRTDLRRVYFDIDALVKIIKQSDLPGKNWWIEQYKK